MNTAEVDTEGRPILVRVAMAGDEARRRGITLAGRPVDDAAQPAATGDQDDLEQFLRERIEQAVRKALPQATEQTLERLRRNARWHDDE